MTSSKHLRELAPEMSFESECGAPSLMQAKGKALTRKGKRLFHPIRLALTGSMSGPDIGDQLRLLEAGEFRLKLCYFVIHTTVLTCPAYIEKEAHCILEH